MSPTELKQVEPHPWRADTITLDLEPAKPEENLSATDYYEILRINPQADEETIERVYRTLADRFHPDNSATGDRQTYLRLGEAYQTLSNPAARSKYNSLRQHSSRFWLRGREFFEGVRGGQNRRLAVLCLLYRRRISTEDFPGLTILDLENQTGCTREEITSALWYLSEKKWATLGDSTAYSITCEGFDFVESSLEDRLEFRSIATLCYYDSSAEQKGSADVEPRFWKNALSLDTDARTIDGDALVVDHYESLGIGPQADDEVIERVYRTLSGRFHPNNPGSGDANTFLRINQAYEILSDPAKRAAYDDLRERSRSTGRFRLQGREFFDGMKGEQLRRLAVLCLLYRQALSESAGLTVLDLEKLTGCTREELSSALWYLREKKWAKSGEYTDYSITAAGFDVVENKLDDRETGRSRPWLASGDDRTDARRGEFVHQAPTPALLIAQSPYDPERPEATISNENIEAGKTSEDLKVTERPMPIEANATIENVASFDEGGETEGWEPVRSWAWFNPETCDDQSAQPAHQTSAAQTGKVESTHTPLAAQPTPVEAKQPEAPGLASQPPAAPEPPAVAIENAAPPVQPVARTAVVQPAVAVEKRVILSMGGKGGVGKTSVMTGLAEWFEENKIPVTLLDLDIENKAIGSLTHFFGGRVPKINIHTPAGLDAFVDNLGENTPVILADMGAGAGMITHDWFDKMYPDVADFGVAFTAIGVVTSDPASVESVLNWAEALQYRVNYVVVENHLTEHPDFSYWRENELAEEFRQRFQPSIIKLDYRLSDLENTVRNHGVTLGQVACRTTRVAELQKASLVMRAQSYRRRMFAEFDKVKELLLP